MKQLIVHQVNIAHYRLIELSQLADQSKPFYDWVEKQSKKVTNSHQSLNDILLKSSIDTLKKIILSCYADNNDNKPMLFDGIGRVYKHSQACFYFFAWIIRDAPKQRLSPLISRMRQIERIETQGAEIDTLAVLIYEYKSHVKSFEWLTVREVIIDRLEGSRRSIRGHRLESNIRIALITAIQTFFAVNNNYGKYKAVEIAPKQIKMGNHTIDVSAKLISFDSISDINLLIPIKTRETEGGGHSHIFTRDITKAINDLKTDGVRFIVVIIAENWSSSELENINNEIDQIFYFKMNPNIFSGFDEDSQIQLNKYISNILNTEG